MSAPTTFERFGELLREPQMQIWRYAATPDGVVYLDDDLFWNIDPFPVSSGDIEPLPFIHVRAAFSIIGLLMVLSPLLAPT